MKTGIELYRNGEDVRQGLQLDVSCVIARLIRAFPAIQFEEEYFQRQIERVKALLNGVTDSPALSIAVGDAEERGPGFSFLVESSEGEPLKGSLSRYRLSFTFDDSVEEALRVKARCFIDSFEIKRTEKESNE